MNTKAVESPSTSAADIAKLVLAIAIVVGSVVAFYWFNNWSSALRIILLFGAVILATAIASFTEPGRKLRTFLTEANYELRKVVWPTRDETIRTTAVIIVVVIILSLMIGLIDFALKWAVLDIFLKPGGGANG